MKLLFLLLVAGIGVSREVQSAAARQLLPSTFVIPPRQSSASPSRDSSTRPLFMAPPPTPTLQEIEAESEKLRKEIEELREEALRRLKALDEQLSGATLSASLDVSSEQLSVAEKNEEGLLPAPTPIVFTQSKGSSEDSKPKTAKKRVKKGINNLLDETRWKITLSIGREPGTWMPKTWGVSGQRLNLSFTAEFAPSQLFDRDDFLRGGYSNAKIFHVIDNKITLGPSISEGQRVYNVRDGGWQVTRGDGPMGTDMLRFYIEIDEEINRGDVYVPKGRVYCSCGYFPCVKNGEYGNSIKEAYLKELQEYDAKILRLEEKKATIKNPFNFEGIQISREIYKLNREAERVNERLAFARVREPDKNLLKFSKDGDVGLTKEGGVCCRVDKGLAVEYHILGRFSVASIDRD